MLSFLIIIGMSTIFHQYGFRFLLKHKIFGQQKDELYAYTFLMLSGIVVGEYISIVILPDFFHLSYIELIGTGTLISILMGETVYYRNDRLIKRMITMENKK
ncbi:hypothetical protein [Tepidibacillus sp. LV47]|uniref:hypothetical protein n=1 Tax=Tepidibacillus sp. LV47 TaxID=3398228 RepID=UPI003AAB6D79